MPNIEIKAKCRDIEKAKNIAAKLKTAYQGKLHQVDTYYFTKKGKLKVREIDGKESQLIPYIKNYSKGPMKSLYELLPVNDPKNLKSILEQLFGLEAIVDKTREVFMIDNIRVHLDVVKNLGNFIEFEAVYYDDSEAAKERESLKLHKLMETFNIKEDDLMDKSYIDYLT